MKMNCLIIDDEPLARQGLADYVKDIDFLHLVAECENSLKATPYLSHQNIDLMFLDIHMPKISGIDFLKTLRTPPLVIFTTAYPQYAIEGYALDVTDYLVKPITFERFLKAAQKAYDLFALRRHAGSTEKDEYFFVKSEGKFEKIFFRDVLYAEAMQNYVVIHTTGRKLIAYITMSALEEQLPKESFIKVHKSFIIAVPHVSRIDGNEVVIGDVSIPISRTLKEEVVSQILGNRLFRRSK